MIADVIKALVRKRSPVIVGDLHQARPVSRIFGMERGTPIDRYYIEKFIGEHAGLVRGCVLEIGESRYSRTFSFGEVVKFEVLDLSSENTSATIHGDLTIPASLPEALADCFICTQTFNFIYDLESAVQGAWRLLKPGGALLATMAGICQISRYDMERWGDFWRFTSASAEKLFQRSFQGGVIVESHGNLLAAQALLQGVTVEDLSNPSLLDISDPDYQVVITVVARKAQ